MLYKELIQFEPITTVVKLVNASQQSVAENLVKTFVFSKKMQEDLREVIFKNLATESIYETKGIQIVGSYGTGKSHLMSLVSAIAENADLVQHIQYEDLKKDFNEIAGKYNVLRFEIGTDKPLKDIVFAQIERHLSKHDVDYKFDSDSNFSWKELIQQMMAEFELKFPSQHFLIVIDELLEYLKGRKPSELHNDLMLLRQLGEACDDSRFKLMFGVQELLYRSPEFQFQADMLNKIEDRYADLIITKEDVSYVVKERLLKKDVHQKAKIRAHLLKFAHLFEGINTNLNDFIDLFPVHPNYVSYFEKIKHGKSQREILKVLSIKFGDILVKEVPTENPGLITYDTYWPDLANNPAMLAIPDIRAVRDKVDIIAGRVANHFTGARANRRGIAESISQALAIRILCDDLDKRNGASAHSLKEDLCVTIPQIDEAELLLDAISSTAKQLVTATAGQYVAQDPISADFYIRTEGGINIPQLIRDYADEVIKKDVDQADQYYFDLLQYILEIQQDSYRSGFKIWEHSLEWIDKKSFRLGYIFFGNPNERSTTEPIQQYYIFFCPLFNNIDRNDEADEVYFDVAGLSDEFKDTICLYGAAKAKHVSASTDQKQLFSNQIEHYQRKAIALFDKEYIDQTRVIYKGDSKSLKSYPLLGDGSTKEMIFRSVAAKVLNKSFNEKYTHYPAFTDLLQPLTKDNFEGRIKAALKKITAASQPNRDGEAILSGLGLWGGHNIISDNSKYAESIKKKMKEAGDGAVLNRSEIIWAHYAPANLWYSVDFNIDYQLEFIVLAALAYKGDIEVNWSGSKSLSATNIETVLTLADEDYFTFQHIKQPQGIPVKHLKALFSCLSLPDYTSELEKPETISKIITEAKAKAEKVVKTRAAISQGLKCRNVPLLSEEETERMKTGLEELGVMLDSIQSYNSYGKLKSFKFKDEELGQTFKAWSYCELIDRLKEKAEKFEKLVGYLYTAKSYVVQEEKPLFGDMNAAIDSLPSVVSSSKDSDIKKYEALLNSLIDSYADYYLGQYTRSRLSSQDGLAKERILTGESKRVCDIIKDSELINATEYQNWLNNITSLREAAESLTKSSVIEEPYHDFNPREYYGKPSYAISQLEEQLYGILEKWTMAMRSVFRDPSVQENMDILTPADKQLVEGFRSGAVALTSENAPRLRNLIAQFARGIDKVEITMEDIHKQLNKPLTPEEAIDTLTSYINTLCLGKERNKVRIIIK
ncbi:hypothetical protein SAMN05192574_102262 [Mucilaginibacter gossypiicola]|uniref:Uncharacterized protein n=1 Tax=Mucilaginibacter gossypiicola TaxID=551995 RepID=A0A1H8D9V0_9SPHI|nr:DUF6079 family protein [Mucilaginibacter gossypiicola]SEN03895.1 hypothetical protein SAMN05192574_102262 [Mucilaginibacter gossypiicola]